MLVRDRCQALEIAPQVMEVLLEKVPLPALIQQLDWLPFRHARDAAAMYVSAVQGGWAQPSGYDPDQASAIWAEWMGTDAASVPAEEDIARAGACADAGEGAFVIASCDASGDAKEVWARVLQEMRLQMTRATFDTWLSGSQVSGVREDTLIVRVRDEYAVDWLRSRWRVPIQRTLSGIVGREMDVRFEA